METGHTHDLLQETIGRTRAAIAQSHASIERSDDRVRNSLSMLMRWRSHFEHAAAALRFDVASPILSDEDLACALERWQAAVEQHQVWLEMQRTHILAEAASIPLKPTRLGDA